jgi:heme exporter protein B
MLLMYPGDRRSIYVGKVIANLTFVLLVEAVLVPMAIVMYNLPVGPDQAGVIGVLLLGTTGFVTLGTFYAAMASRVRAREVLLPLLLFPMLVPLLVASVEATAALLLGDPMGDSGAWIKLLLVYDAVFLAVSYVAFEYVIED